MPDGWEEIAIRDVEAVVLSSGAGITDQRGGIDDERDEGSFACGGKTGGIGDGADVLPGALLEGPAIRCLRVALREGGQFLSAVAAGRAIGFPGDMNFYLHRLFPRLPSGQQAGDVNVLCLGIRGEDRFVNLAAAVDEEVFAGTFDHVHRGGYGDHHRFPIEFDTANAEGFLGDVDTEFGEAFRGIRGGLGGFIRFAGRLESSVFGDAALCGIDFPGFRRIRLEQGQERRDEEACASGLGFHGCRVGWIQLWILRWKAVAAARMELAMSASGR
ncbi:MAG: hypothetical protein RLZ97_1835, partial [Verrucomicrobiota bacterium]